jgi:hypothetical protein
MREQREQWELGKAVTGMCLANTNYPLTDHIHICGTKEPHRQHRCHCGSQWTAWTARGAEVKS